MTNDYVEQLQSNRAEKDQFFAEHPQSPIPPEERADFDGLAYFDPDPDARVEATITIHDDPETVEMDTTAGRTVQYRHVATFSVPFDGHSVTLAGYRQSEDDALFVPFRDKTTGQQTYEGGRYMELEPTDTLEDGSTITIDFNLAYAPFCAYNESFDCPLPPEENWLDVAVEAGERSR